MKTPRGSGNSSRTAIRRKVGTPGTAGLTFEAATLEGTTGSGTSGVGKEVFSYDEVSGLATVTPAADRFARAGASKAVGKASRSGEEEQAGGTQEQLDNGRQPRRSPGASKADAESGAAKRRKRRQEQQTAAEMAAAAAAAEARGRTSYENNGPGMEEGGMTGPTEPENGEATEAEKEGTVSEDLRAKQATAPGTHESMANQARAKKSADASATRTTRRARKVPRYPDISFAPCGKATSIAEALEEAVAAEVQGLIRKRGQEDMCRSAVHACVDVGKEIRRQAVDIGIDLDPMPPLDLKALRRAFDDERRRRRAIIEAEEKLWAVEERQCLALVERNKRAQAKLDAMGERRARECQLAAGNGVRHETAIDTLEEDEQAEKDEEEAAEFQEGVGTAKRVSDELLASTNDMLLNASAIGRCLQEMGAGVADAQEAKEELARLFQQHAFKNYPNVDDPKAGIAALLK